MNIYFSYIGAAIATATLLWMAWSFFTKRVPATSPATWLMWTVLDSLLTITSYVADPTGLGWLLPFGWTFGAMSCTIATLVRGKWTWSWGETLCAVSAGIAAYFWLTISAFAGVVAGTIAMVIAGLPVAVEMFRTPIRGTFPVWAWTVVADTFFLFGSNGTLEGVFLPAGSLLYCFAVALLVLRGK